VRKRILVTGGAGFIGSHLCTRLLEEGGEVICLDNFFTGSKENIRHLIGHPNFEWMRHDVVNPLMLEVDQIYSLACPASPVHYQFNPVKTIKTSVMGTIHMLGLAKRVRARMLLASTSEVYGDPREHPQSETYWGHVNPNGIRSCYDEGKRCAETLCWDYHRQNGVDVRIARIFNTYGPRMSFRDGRVVSNFILRALQGEPLELFGTGEQTRSFCYVGDTVEGLIRLMNTPQERPDPVNLGNPVEVTIRELADRICRLTGSLSARRNMPLPADDPGRRCPDISRARTLLDWSPRVDLDEGLARTVDDFRRRMFPEDRMGAEGIKEQES